MTNEAGSSEQAEIAARLTRVREEVRSRPPLRGLSGGTRLEARNQAEQYWPVTADRGFLRAPGTAGRLRALAAAPVKAAVRGLVHWYVEPALADQRHFNSAILGLVDDLDARMAALEEGRSPGDGEA